MPIRASSASSKPRDGHTFTLDLEPSGKLTDLSVRAVGKRAHLLSELFRQAGAERQRPGRDDYHYSRIRERRSGSCPGVRFVRRTPYPSWIDPRG
jgi:hypothetical protein